MTADPKANTTEPAEDPTPDTDAPEPAPDQGDDLGDDRLAELARPFLDQPDAGQIEVHHGPPPAELPAEATSAPYDMPNMRFGQSVFAELARESAGLYGDWPELPPPPAFIDGPDGLAAKFDEARTANEDGFVADKANLAAWMRAARANTHGSGIAA